MSKRRPSLMEILRPRRFQGHPKRAEVTRTVIQPEIDAFERLEAEAEAAGRVARMAEGADTGRYPAPHRSALRTSATGGGT